MFRKVLFDQISYRAKKFNVVEDYFYGADSIDYTILRRQKITKYEDLVIYRGKHICES